MDWFSATIKFSETTYLRSRIEKSPYNQGATYIKSHLNYARTSTSCKREAAMGSSRILGNLLGDELDEYWRNLEEGLIGGHSSRIVQTAFDQSCRAPVLFVSVLRSFCATALRFRAWFIPLRQIFREHTRLLGTDATSSRVLKSHARDEWGHN